jgi:predicted glycosyltransferase
MVIMDYEFVKGLKWTKPQWLMIPELMPASATDFDLKRILTYPGIKEDVYVSTFKPKSEIEADAPCNGQKTLAVIRPPATEAHYHVPESDQMFHDIVEFLDRHSDVSMVILPRNQKQESAIRKSYAHMLERGKITIPSSAINGLDLIWRSDLVISGGGTMNREAAAMGVPVYSIFRGTIGAVDRYLAREGRLTMLESAQDIRSKLIVKPRSRGAIARSANARTLDAIVGQIDSAWETTKSGRAVGQ